MENFDKIWRAFFALGIIAIAVQQLFCGDFRPVIIPEAWPAWLQHEGRLVSTWIVSLSLIAAGIAILFDLKARTISLLLGVLFLLLVIVVQIPYQSTHYPLHLGSWTNPFKTLVLSGGAFVVAGSLPLQGNNSGFTKSLGMLIPVGKYFMAITMATFGWMHFLYPDFVTPLVPNWIPWHLFWTYFAGVALMLSGIAIIINIQRRTAAALLGLMILLWFIMLHVPRAIADPHTGNGNEWTSVFEALAFSGIAFIIAGKRQEAK